MSIQRATIKNNFKSNMKLIQLHSDLNQALEQFHQYLNATKNIEFAERMKKREDEQRLLQSIRGINDHIQSLTTVRKRQRLA